MELSRKHWGSKFKDFCLDFLNLMILILSNKLDSSRIFEMFPKSSIASTVTECVLAVIIALPVGGKYFPPTQQKTDPGMCKMYECLEGKMWRRSHKHTFVNTREWEKTLTENENYSHWSVISCDTSVWLIYIHIQRICITSGMPQKIYTLKLLLSVFCAAATVVAHFMLPMSSGYCW